MAIFEVRSRSLQVLFTSRVYCSHIGQFSPFLPSYETSLHKLTCTDSIRKSSFPISFVMTAITPCHFALTLSYVIDELAFIFIAVCPLKNSNSVFLIILKLSLIVITFGIAPYSLPVSQPLHKITFVD